MLVRNRWSVLGFFLLASLICRAQVVPTFTAGQTFPASGTSPTGVAVGDLDGDGIPDLVVCNRGESTVVVLIGNGDGTFRAPVTYDLSKTEPFLQTVVVADFNNDGKLDVAVESVNYQSPYGGEVAVLLGNGDGTLNPIPITSGGDSAPIQMLAVDLNGDKKIDLVIGGNGSPQVLYGNGDGTFKAPVYLPGVAGGPACFGVAVADFNGDGRLDVAVVTFGWADGSGVYMGINLQNPDGSFSQGFTYPFDPAMFQFGYGIAAGDLNGDGKPDVVLGCYGSGLGAIFFGNGDGTFQAPQSFILGSGANTMVLADFNNDRRLDLEVGNFEQSMSGVSVYVNPGTGLFDFLNSASLATAGGTTQATYGDFNLDGYLDVASVDFTANVVSVFLNTTGGATQPLNVASSGNGSVISGEGFIKCGKVCLHRYPNGTALTLTAMPAVGSTFVGWNGCTSQHGNLCGVVANVATSVTATFHSAKVNFNSLSFGPSTIRKGQLAVGTLTLNSPAPVGGITLSATSSQPSLVTVPATICVPGGASTFKFAVRSISPRPLLVTIAVTDGTGSVFGTLNVTANSLTPTPGATRTGFGSRGTPNIPSASRPSSAAYIKPVDFGDLTTR